MVYWWLNYYHGCKDEDPKTCARDVAHYSDVCQVTGEQNCGSTCPYAVFIGTFYKKAKCPNHGGRRIVRCPDPPRDIVHENAKKWFPHMFNKPNANPIQQRLATLAVDEARYQEKRPIPNPPIVLANAVKRPIYLPNAIERPVYKPGHSAPPPLPPVANQSASNPLVGSQLSLTQQAAGQVYGQAQAYNLAGGAAYGESSGANTGGGFQAGFQRGLYLGAQGVQSSYLSTRTQHQSNPQIASQTGDQGTASNPITLTNPAEQSSVGDSQASSRRLYSAASDNDSHTRILGSQDDHNVRVTGHYHTQPQASFSHPVQAGANLRRARVARFPGTSAELDRSQSPDGGRESQRRRRRGPGEEIIGTEFIDLEADVEQWNNSPRTHNTPPKSQSQMVDTRPSSTQPRNVRQQPFMAQPSGQPAWAADTPPPPSPNAEIQESYIPPGRSLPGDHPNDPRRRNVGGSSRQATQQPFTAQPSGQPAWAADTPPPPSPNAEIQESYIPPGRPILGDHPDDPRWKNTGGSSRQGRSGGVRRSRAPVRRKAKKINPENPLHLDTKSNPSQDMSDQHTAPSQLLPERPKVSPPQTKSDTTPQGNVRRATTQVSEKSAVSPSPHGGIERRDTMPNANSSPIPGSKLEKPKSDASGKLPQNISATQGAVPSRSSSPAVSIASSQGSRLGAPKTEVSEKKSDTKNNVAQGAQAQAKQAHGKPEGAKTLQGQPSQGHSAKGGPAKEMTAQKTPLQGKQFPGPATQAAGAPRATAQGLNLDAAGKASLTRVSGAAAAAAEKAKQIKTNETKATVSSSPEKKPKGSASPVTKTPLVSGSPAKTPTVSASPTAKNQAPSASSAAKTPAPSAGSAAKKVAGSGGPPASRPTTPASRPTTPASKPAAPALKLVIPAGKPAAPASKPATPVSKPAAPSSKPATPVSKPATTRSSTPAFRSSTPTGSPAKTPAAAGSAKKNQIPGSSAGSSSTGKGKSTGKKK